MRILLVDDDRYLAEVLKNSLAKQHYAVDAVFDGEAGWHYGSTFAYNAIVLDVVLPKLDGLTLCKQLRDRGYQLPILLLTARDSSADIVKGLDAGADDYVVKPCELEELMARIRALLRREKQNILYRFP
jgi:DNA-binding response OmpR family regulator